MVSPIDGDPPLGKVYFQPKTNITRVAPYILYERDRASNKFADNMPYSHTKRYQVTIVDEDPDNPIADKVALLPMSTFQRQFATANLTHDIYSLYF